MSKLDIKSEMNALDNKDRDFYHDLSEDEQKKFSPYLMIRWGASVEGSAELQEYYLTSTNERLNHDFFNISAKDHKEFQWLLASTISPGIGNSRHYWLAAKKQSTVPIKIENFLRELYPHMNDQELELMATINDKESLRNIARSLGWDDRRIKTELA